MPRESLVEIAQLFWNMIVVCGCNHLRGVWRNQAASICNMPARLALFLGALLCTPFFSIPPQNTIQINTVITCNYTADPAWLFDQDALTWQKRIYKARQSSRPLKCSLLWLSGRFLNLNQVVFRIQPSDTEKLWTQVHKNLSPLDKVWLYTNVQGSFKFLDKSTAWSWWSQKLTTANTWSKVHQFPLVQFWQWCSLPLELLVCACQVKCQQSELSAAMFLHLCLEDRGLCRQNEAKTGWLHVKHSFSSWSSQLTSTNRTHLGYRKFIRSGVSDRNNDMHKKIDQVHKWPLANTWKLLLEDCLAKLQLLLITFPSELQGCICIADTNLLHLTLLFSKPTRHYCSS